MHGGVRPIAAAVICLLGLTSCTHGAGSTGDRVDKADGELAFRQGELSARAAACGLDWKALSFRPMMARWRRLGKSKEQVAVLAAMHGIGQGQTAAELGKSRCTEAMRRDVRAQLPFKR